MPFHLITLIVFSNIVQLHVYVGQKVVDNNFYLIQDFEKNRLLFTSDTFDLINHSTDGGKLMAFYNNERDYLVFDIWLFGETGKIHTTYWTDKNLNFKIVRRINFAYDKPYYEEGYKVTVLTEYLSYSDHSVKRYDADKKELIGPVTNEKIIEAENFFKAITKDFKIVK